jgi:phosphoribosyl 1,2-cyclic phosphodiesterase
MPINFNPRGQEEYPPEHLRWGTSESQRRPNSVKCSLGIGVILVLMIRILFRTIVIDVGKNFQAAALEWFPKYGLRRIDAVLITHAHADGLSDLVYMAGKQGT